VERWNGRAVRGALIRLEQTRYLRRFTVEKTSNDPRLVSNRNHFICIQRLREPIEDDIRNLKFKRMAETSAADATEEELLDTDDAGGGSMQELEQDLMNDVSDGDGDGDGDEDRRIPPQWTPDRLLTNLVVDAVETAGTDGTDTAKLRDITTGFFWKRPIESLVTRLTDGWDKHQPMHVRHLALVRDTAMAVDKKRVHYLYRTHQNFQKAVDVGEVTWDALELDENKKGARSKKPQTSVAVSSVDSWGFLKLNLNDFHQGTGTSSLAESCAAIVKKKRNPRDWEAKLMNGESPLQTLSTPGQEATGSISKSPLGYRGRVHKSKTIPRPLLTQAERLILGLPSKGRLGLDYESQIRAHRNKTGDPNSIPDNLIKGLNVDERTPRPKYERRPGPPLLTREERKARGLPEHGRLSFKVTEQILREQGRNEPLTHIRGSIDADEPSLPVYGAHTNDGDEESEGDQVSSSMAGPQRLNERVDSITDKEDTAPPRTVGEKQPTQNGRGSRKRPIAEGGRKAGRPKKRTRREYDTSMDQGSSIEGHHTEQIDGFVATEAADTELLEGMNTDPDVSEASLHIDESQADRNAVLTPSAPVNERASAETGDPATPSQKLKPSAKECRGPYKKHPELKPKVPVTEAELQVNESETHYANRVESGVYINPHATRPGKGGRGRPKKMFLATFKLSGLHQFDWFVLDTGYQSNSAAPSIAHRDDADTESSRLKKKPTLSPSRTISPTDDVLEPSPTPFAQTKAVETTDTMDTEGTEPMQDSASAFASIDAATPMEIDQPSDAIYTSHEAISEVSGPDEQPLEGIDASEASRRSTSLLESRASDGRVITDALEHIPIFERSIINPPVISSTHLNSSARREPLRSPIAMDNETSVLTTLLQSPYSPGPSQAPPQAKTPNANHKEASVADRDTHDNTPRDPPSVLETSVTEATVSTQASQKKKDIKIGRGVILGKGSVAHARTRIIRHILDLCGGVFPGTEVMYPVFASVWEELGPKSVACPIPGTIRRAVIDLCHPHSDLREVKFTVPRKDLPGNKTRSVFFYKHLDFSSPEVQSVVKGVIQTYPEKYCPPGVTQYWKEEVKPVPVMPKIDNSYLAELYPPTSRRLDERIKEARKERRRLAKEALEEQRRVEKAAMKEQKRLAKEQKRQQRLEISESRRKLFKDRQRLGGLNDGLHTGAGNQHPLLRTTQSSLSTQQSSEIVPAADSSDEEPLTNKRPLLQAANGDLMQLTASSRGDQSGFQGPVSLICPSHAASLMSPVIGYHSSTHTFSTLLTVNAPDEVKTTKEMSRKRVRIEQPADQASRKKPRKSRPSKISQAKHSGDDFLTRHHIEIQESSDEEDDEQNEVDTVTSPTIAQRLAGLTGDLNKPDYEPIKRKRWSEHRDRRHRDRTKRKNNAVRERKYPKTFDQLGEFRKLCYTLVIASSMSGEDGDVDWNIVKDVYVEIPRFDLEKTKRKWAWMQKKMVSQLRGMTSSFQSKFLSAYEEGKIDPIEDPATYDWDKLVRWACLNCTYLEPPLPLSREAFDDCQFDLSSYEVLDRTIWYNTTLANINRDERFAKYAFGSPLHGTRKLTIREEEEDLKARALIRANISTPKELYDKTLAYEKLKKHPVSVIGRSVNDLIQASLIKQRKIKRLLPGRNYHFTAGFAKNYRRTFELSDFMAAAQLKKDLDTAFTNTDPDKRTYLVSRAAENGTVMALISLASEGTIKLVPQLPPINNDFNAPIPRISVWGFSEGDYQHRLMDRKRLFWPLAVVPTDSYKHGNPLYPTSPSPASAEDSPIVWNPMPEPPLPAREQDSNALLPIWNTIDGQTVIYPWWNRILNIVIQAILFQPSITAQEIFNRCEPYTTEIFEIQLVLDWLVTVHAAKRLPHGTYEALPCHWAVFGDKLIDEENDEFGEHVRRLTRSKKLVPTWRTEYNMDYNLRSQQAKRANDEVAEGNGASTSTGEQILGNVRKQYTIVKDALQNQNMGRAGSAGERQSAQALQEGVVSTTPTPSTTTQDVEMTDPDADAEGEELDAEGESDDEYL
jgi:hypothetical protein